MNLVKTAIATVVNVNSEFEASMLLDETLQWFLVTEKHAGMLGVVPHSCENINLSLYRGMHIVTFHIKTWRGDYVEPISVLGVPTSGALLANSMNTTVSILSRLKGLPLAHPVSGERNFEISLLVGAYIWCDLIDDHTVIGNGPREVNFRLGYLLFSPLPVSQSSSVVTSLLNMVMEHSREKNYKSIR